MKFTPHLVSKFRLKITFILFSVLEIILLSHCSPHIGNPFAQPTNTPPPGFLTIESLVPGEIFSQPTFSADSQLIALGGYGDIGSQTIARLYVIDLQSDETVFVSSEGVYRGLSLSPDGNQIAVYTGGPANDTLPSGVIFLLDINTDTSSQLTRGDFPTWSPDGSQWAFAYIVSRAALEEQLHIQIKIRNLSIEGEKIVFDNLRSSGHILDIVWSPNGGLLAFIMDDYRSSNSRDLYVLDLENESVRQLTENQPILSLNFSPDSNKILYLADTTPTDSGGFRLYVTDLEGNCHQLSESLLIDGTNSVTLSPNGEWIAFDTHYEGVQIAETETALGSDFWTTNSSCE